MLPDVESILESFQEGEITMTEAMRLINLHIEFAEARAKGKPQ